MIFQKAPDIQKRLNLIIKRLCFQHVRPQQLVAFRSFGSKAQAHARIWSFPRIWQQALETKPHYCIEVISEKFDHLSLNEKTKILIHELLHIPKTFSGALLPHRNRGQQINRHTVDKLYRQFKKQPPQIILKKIFSL